MAYLRKSAELADVCALYADALRARGQQDRAFELIAGRGGAGFQQAPDPALAVTPARPRGEGGMPGTVLIADDDEPRASRLRGILQRAGHRVITATDGAAALRLLSAHECDLLLCETQLPDMDGLDVCRAIKQAPATRDTPVVMLIDEDDDVQRERALQAGANDVCIKPIEPARLLEVVRSQLEIGR